MKAFGKERDSQAAVLLITADQAFAQSFATRFADREPAVAVSVYVRPAQARNFLRRHRPAVIVLDEAACASGRGSSAAGTESPLATAAIELARRAPVAVIASPSAAIHLSNLARLVAAGQIDLIPRAGGFSSLAAALVERRLSGFLPGAETLGHTECTEPNTLAGFGEVLRHELNNPLTGILGNAELILAHRQQLPADAVERMEVIADLAVRLRETVRRLSREWESSEEIAPADPSLVTHAR